jgi:hypothetical protein
MDGVAIASAISLVGALVKEALAINELISKAQAENRDITDEEWAALELAQTEAHNELRASIAKREQDELAGD